MSCYVSKLEKNVCAPIPEFCRLTGDSIEELQAMGVQLGMRPNWLQVHRSPAFFIISPIRRAQALKKGAKEKA